MMRPVRVYAAAFLGTVTLAGAFFVGTVPLAGAVVPDFGPDFTPSKELNMNGEYPLSATPGSKNMSELFPNQYRDYPGGAEMFEVYSPPITTLYSQIWWTALPPAAIPEDIVKKYAGKGMAIVGWEIDQVRKGAGLDGEDVSVPISASYNHHYNLNIAGANARFKKIMLSGPDDPNAADIVARSHGAVQWDQPHYVVEDIKPSASGHPNSAFITSGNGGEYRKTRHGFAPGYAIVLDSPTEVQLSPMQIDTWNRDEMDISGKTKGPVKFVAGPLPAASEAPTENSEYSGLLECPMTTRLVKNIDGKYVVQSKGMCGESIMTFQECFHAVASTMAGGSHTFINSTGSDEAIPAGCTASVKPETPGQVHVFFNTLSSSTTQCGANSAAIVGAATSLASVEVVLTPANNSARITLAGPSDVWFGVGFNASAMKDAPWAIVVDGHGAITERKLSDQGGNNILLKPSVTVVSSAVTGAVRTVVLTRPLVGSSSDYYTFVATSLDATTPFITAVGSGPAFAYHKNKAIGSLSYLPTTGGACVCPEAPKAFGQASGEMTYRKTAQKEDVGAGSVGFRGGKCAPFPTTVLLDQKNPTCDIRHYQGGQWACHHMWSLLDAEQDIPWPDQPLVFSHKWRFWVQPFLKDYHKPLHFANGAGLYLGSPYEYDVPKCSPTVPGCALVNGTWIHTITGSKTGSGSFVSLNFHCHAPTCLVMSVYACPAGTKLANCTAGTEDEAVKKGYKLICRQVPVYGGSGNPSVNGSRFDEAGYIAIPQCYWGSPEQGLESPINVDGVPLFMIKTANATRGHYGEMAGGQPFEI